jgi:hypothetical protein
MKNYLLTFIFVLFFCNAKAQTNVYHPFPDSSASWNFTGSGFCYGPFGVQNISHQMSYLFGLDTVINSITYHTLQNPAVIMNTGLGCWGTPVGVYVLPGAYKGAIRNDHAGRKTYIIPEGDSTEWLLYDFNLQVGDTLKGYLARHQSALVGGIDTVISIDSVQVGSTWRNRWNLSNPYFAYLIEGVGSTYSLVQAIPGPLTVDDINYVFDCFSQNQIPLYPAGAIGCPVLTDIEEQAEHEVQLVAYPNPAEKLLYLQLPFDCTNQILEVSISGIDGKKYFQQFVMATQKSIVEITLPDLKSGMYQVQVVSAEKQLQSRFMVIK